MRRAAALGLLALVALPLAAQAAGPFGVLTPDSTGGFGGPLGPFFLWVASYQAAFSRALSTTIADLRQNPWGVWLLIGLSFAYGVFHAVGPGHGKAVITSYLLSSGEDVRRGVAISFAAALVQALSAIVVVFAGAVVLRITAPVMARATDWMEIGSYAAIALVGAWLLWTKSVGGGHHHHHHHHVVTGQAGDDAHDHGDDDGHDDDHDHHHDHHNHHHDEHDHHGHDGHVHHDHRDSVQVAATGRGSIWQSVRRAWTAIVAVGVRPCSGAIIVLVFSLSQGLILAGVAATVVMALGTGLTVAALAALAVSAKGLALRLAGTDAAVAFRLVRGLEIAAAAAVLVFGLALLGGALVNGLP